MDVGVRKHNIEIKELCKNIERIKNDHTNSCNRFWYNLTKV